MSQAEMDPIHQAEEYVGLIPMSRLDEFALRKPLAMDEKFCKPFDRLFFDKDQILDLSEITVTQSEDEVSNIDVGGIRLHTEFIHKSVKNLMSFTDTESLQVRSVAANTKRLLSSIKSVHLIMNVLTTLDDEMMYGEKHVFRNFSEGQDKREGPAQPLDQADITHLYSLMGPVLHAS